VERVAEMLGEDGLNMLVIEAARAEGVLQGGQ